MSEVALAALFMLIRLAYNVASTPDGRVVQEKRHSDGWQLLDSRHNIAAYFVLNAAAEM
jgi:hypothetical protein